eukprot:TRINITY_DN9258_c0_g1_i1.p1 TRINITY_DN9258_c0_g1~~TRINITY_DN9258_c0_g1_i1.p1  ORF type:complete len:465 (+),score=98.45 TRINITY_DN9258_c0_g1_i1:154-1548(+)
MFSTNFSRNAVAYVIFKSEEEKNLFLIVKQKAQENWELPEETFDQDKEKADLIIQQAAKEKLDISLESLSLLTKGFDWKRAFTVELYSSLIKEGTPLANSSFYDEFKWGTIEDLQQAKDVPFSASLFINFKTSQNSPKPGQFKFSWEKKSEGDPSALGSPLNLSFSTQTSWSPSQFQWAPASISDAQTSPTLPPATATPTGEENESTLLERRTRLNRLDTKTETWIPIGSGKLKLNQNKESKRLRIIVRADSTFRLILNAPIFEGIPISVLYGKALMFSVRGNQGNMETYNLRFQSEDDVREIIFLIGDRAIVKRIEEQDQAVSNRTIGSGSDKDSSGFNEKFIIDKSDSQEVIDVGGDSPTGTDQVSTKKRKWEDEGGEEEKNNKKQKSSITSKETMVARAILSNGSSDGADLDSIKTFVNSSYGVTDLDSDLEKLVTDGAIELKDGRYKLSSRLLELYDQPK